MGRQLREQIDGLDQSQLGLGGLASLKTMILDAAANVEVARVVGDELIGLQDDLANAGQVEVARGRANELMALNQDLMASDMNLAIARTNFDQLIAMRDALAGQTTAIVDAVNTLEILSAFREEFMTQVQVLGEMRRSLTDIALLESTYARAVRALQPLTELANLKNLSDQEIREAARNILDTRSGRIANLPEKTTHIEPKAEVPMPVDAE
jgi:hypothetical protein